MSVAPSSSENRDWKWRRDILGAPFQQLTLSLSDDEEGACIATLVRSRPEVQEVPPPKRRWWAGRAAEAPPLDPGPARAVLYIHGWSDYFFQVGLAEHWNALGAHFYALDLRKYGRSLLEWQTPGYVDDLDAYDEEIRLALEVIRSELGPDAAISLMGHSTGGLTASLWADRHPGEISSLILNSPWLELQGSAVVRMGIKPLVTGLSKINKMHAYPNIDLGYYSRAAKNLGWVWNEDWRPTPSFTVRRGWLSAILKGHTRVAAGLDIRVPVLLMTSARSTLSPVWSDGMESADAVLDVPAVRERGLSLGPLVTLVAIPGGLHDLALSAPEPRAEFYRQLTLWAQTYAWAGVEVAAAALPVVESPPDEAAEEAVVSDSAAVAAVAAESAAAAAEAAPVGDPGDGAPGDVGSPPEPPTASPSTTTPPPAT